MSIELYETKQYFLSSSSGTKNNGSYNSDITFYIPKLIERKDLILYNTIRISHAEIPYSFYIVNEYNNTFQFNSNTVTLPFGNYNGFTLMNAINQEIQVYDASASLALNQTTGRYTMTSTLPFTLNTNMSQIYKIIGLEKGNYSGQFNFSNSLYELYFTYPLNTSGSRNLYIKATNFVLDNLNTSTNDKATLKSISCNVPPFGIIMYNNNENVETLVKNPETNYINIQITDDENNLVNFNNIDWSICLEIKSKLTLIKTSYNELISSQ